MSYCINPKCPHFHKPSNADEHKCPNCGTERLLQGRYRLIKPLGKGNFGQTFEVDDLRGAVSGGATRKVLKVLLTDCPEAVSLFQREAKVLIQLRHPGIPKVQPDGYFQFWLQDSQKPLHCLVMEKIEGINLEDWLSNRHNQPITQEKAIAWLKQLAQIVAIIHLKHYLHRDIKPSNIMLKPDGKLVLIDFGAVREATETYLHKLEGRRGTVIITSGYTPPEQEKGGAVLPQSDFYALGRTFVHLLTGQYPPYLPKDRRTGKLNWRNSAPQISPRLADLIDRLMATSPANRPGDTQAILRRLAEIPPSAGTTQSSSQPGRKRLAIAGAAIFLALAVTGVYSYFTKVGVNGCSKIWLVKFPEGDNLSCGEEILIQDFAVPEKQEGVKAFAAGDYKESLKLLKIARKKQPNDPETLIYLNNVKLMERKAYAIAVVAPLSDKSLDTAKEILRGVASAQNDFNQRRNPAEPGIKVLIANDDNNPEQAQKIASVLVSKGDVLAVVGHYASEVTQKAMQVYQKNQLVLISAGSIAEQLRPKDTPTNFFFRTVPSTRVNAQALANYLIDLAHQRQAAVFYTPQSLYSQSIRTEFGTSFRERQGQIVAEFNLSDPNFIANDAIRQAQKQGATALVLFPDGRVNRNSLSNALNLIPQTNWRRYWMVGAWALYNAQTLQRVGQDPVNHLVVSVPWHRLSSPNQEFPSAAKKLWGANVSGLTATSYDATLALSVALKQLGQPNRILVQQTLADPNFQTTGATGTITFQGGDRKERVEQLVKVVPSKCSSYGYTFVPVNHPDDKDCEL